MGVVSGAIMIAIGLAWPILYMPAGAYAAIAPVVPVAPGLIDTIPSGTGLALTPPMGWNGFNRFYHDVNEARVEAQARAIVSSGMQAAGYRYVNLDGGWDLMQRGAGGELVPDPKKFPHGIKPVADYVHSLGLKFGIYSSAGRTNCAHTAAGSYGHYLQDADAFASWGVDYVKLDWCYIPLGDFPGLTFRQVSQELASEMAQAIDSTGRGMVYDINFYADASPWMWGSTVANMWRTGRDSQDQYWSLLYNFTHNVQHFVHARRGAWNDPDMLEIGNGGMSAIEYQAEFSLWAEMAAPLIAGNDLTRMSPQTRSILTNRAVIAIDQDPLGRQGRPVWSSGGYWVLAKQLVGGEEAVVLFNSTSKWAVISTTASHVGMMPAAGYLLDDLWASTSRETAGLVSAFVPPHGVVMYEVSGLDAVNG